MLRPILALTFAALTIGIALADEDKLSGVKEMLRKAFPTVSHVSTDDLARWLSSDQAEDLVLIDTREPEEFEVSYIAGAHLAPSLEEALELLDGVPKDQFIVAYCSVGYRSSILVGKLAAKGYTNVYNLDGSIFEWANRGFPLFRGNEQVKKVHRYNVWWGRLLNEELHAR